MHFELKFPMMLVLLCQKNFIIIIIMLDSALRFCLLINCPALDHDLIE